MSAVVVRPYVESDREAREASASLGFATRWLVVGPFDNEGGAGFESVNIPFKGGAEALSEIIAGRVDFYFCPIATSMPHIKAGRLLGLAVSSPKRAWSQALMNIPPPQCPPPPTACTS